MKHKAKLIPAIGGGKEDPPELLWRVMLFNAITPQEIANAEAYRVAHPDEEAAPTDDAEQLVRQPSPAAFLATFDEAEHPREHGRFVTKDVDPLGRLDAVDIYTVDGDTPADAAARVDATIKLEALLPRTGIDLGTLDGELAPQLVESVERAVDEFPALQDTIMGIQVAELNSNVMGGFLPSSGEIVYNSANFGTSPVEPRRIERDTDMEPSGSFHPLDDAQSTFDHEIGHAVWDIAQREMSRDLKLDPHGIGGGWGQLTDKEMSMRLLGFDPDVLSGARRVIGVEPPKVPTRSITAAMRSMGSKYGALSYMADTVEGGYVETSRSLNEGFAEWFSVRQREPMRDELSDRTKPIIGDAFEKVLTSAAGARRLREPVAAAAASRGHVTCYGYVSIRTWESMTKAEQRAMFPPAAQLAYVEGQARDSWGRFGEGDGSSVLQTVREQGGMTVSPLDASSPTTGYVVARNDVKGAIMSADAFFDPAQGPAAIVAFMDANPEAFDEPGEFIGLWHDTANGEVAIDAVEVMDDRDAAIAAGADRDEQAIWDVEKGEEISTGGTGHRAAATTMSDRGRPSDLRGEAAKAVVRDDARGSAGVGRAGARSDGRGGGLSRSDARLVARLTQLRQSLGTRLLAEAEQAYEAALRSAGVKVISRARSRTSPTRLRQATTAVDQCEALAPWLAAIGLTEEEMLDHAFDTFTERAIEEVRRYRERQAAIVEKLGGGMPLPTDPLPEQVADFLVAGLTAMVRQRLLVGDRAAVMAAIPSLIPRNKLLKKIATDAARDLVKRAPRHRREPDNFDLPTGLPDPDELASAAARLVRNALYAADGRVHVQLPATPDRLPTVITSESTMKPSLEERLVLKFNVAPEWEWVHAFYGEPRTVFEPHEALDGFTTTDREGDPGLFNPESWPDTDLYAPADHDGCTCEWVVAVGHNEE